MSKDFELDPAVEKEIEDTLSEEQIIGEYITGGGENEKLPLVEGWLPTAKDWKGKTIINNQQAQLLAVARILTDIYPEIDNLENDIETLLDNYEKYLTSIEGIGREQHMRVLQALFGGPTKEQEETHGMIMAALAGATRSDNE